MQIKTIAMMAFLIYLIKDSMNQLASLSEKRGTAAWSGMPAADIAASVATFLTLAMGAHLLVKHALATEAPRNAAPLNPTHVLQPRT